MQPPFSKSHCAHCVRFAPILFLLAVAACFVEAESPHEARPPAAQAHIAPVFSQPVAHLRQKRRRARLPHYRVRRNRCAYRFALRDPKRLSHPTSHSMVRKLSIIRQAGDRRHIREPIHPQRLLHHFPPPCASELTFRCSHGIAIRRSALHRTDQIDELVCYGLQPPRIAPVRAKLAR